MSLERSRRAFLIDAGKSISAAALAAIALPILQACEPTSMPTIEDPITGPTDPDGRIGVDISDLNTTNPVKQAVNLRGPDGKGVLVTRISDTEYHALSMECTHEKCSVEKTATNNSIPCFCHGSRFALNGDVVNGPATQALHKYDAVLDAAKQELRIKLT
ncbi:MAG TPA: Rieske (2Fe-2S) protein [Candidatus Kapabacteria bacterium]|nr:Rieske (2Fe-2S) protein [Candidatus Kapabacteria bacterium]